MGFETVALLNGVVMVIVDRLRAVWPRISGPTTNLVALAVGIVVAFAADLSTLGAQLAPAVAAESETAGKLVAGVAIAAGSAIFDQLLPGRK